MKIKILYFVILSLIISCGSPKPRKPIIRKTSSFMAESVERNKILNDKEEELFKHIMKNDSLNEYFNSEFGFWYYYKEKIDLNNEFPVRGDEVIFDYEIRSIQDSVIYTKEELGERNYLVDKEELITGLQEGIKIMKEGEIVIFLFPSHMAYGYTGNERISSNEPLIYNVHLKEIINKN